MNVWYLTALTTGLAGSLHCVGMCGPLAMALPVGRLPRYQRFPAVLLYHAGRLGAYALLGTVVGLTGQGLLLAGLQRPVSIGAGVLLLIFALNGRKFLHMSVLSFIYQLTTPLTKLLRQPSLVKLGAAGFLNGLLPCGFVYLAMTGALAQTTVSAGAIYMALFGIGTLPALLAIRLFQDVVSVKLRLRINRFLPVVTVLLALLLIGRGLGSYNWITIGKVPTVPICHGVLLNGNH